LPDKKVMGLFCFTTDHHGLAFKSFYAVNKNSSWKSVGGNRVMEHELELPLTPSWCKMHSFIPPLVPKRGQGGVKMNPLDYTIGIKRY